ncbi:MAG: NAD(+) synthase [Treponema sp.]|nr:NAD(+) synthase [Treponema sp.]
MFNAVQTKDAVIAWIKNYFKENGPDCMAVIGISGGKDSSIVADLCVKALGAQRVYGVLMPQGEQHDINYSLELVSHLNIRYTIINIKNSVDALLAGLQEGGLAANKQAIINIPARVRMTTLYAVSAIVNGRVANTSNLSEDYVGYATKYGDAAGDFSPLSLLTVTHIKLMARELDLPSKFIDKIPEDGLTGSSDEDILGFSYDVVDKYILEGICDDAVIKEKIDRLHVINQHKFNLIPCYKP